MKFLYLDFETSHTRRDCAPVSLGFALFDNGELIDSAEWFFKPLRDFKGDYKHEYSENARLIHGKSMEWLESNGQTWPLNYKGCKGFLEGHQLDLIVSHQSDFDSGVWSTFLFGMSEWDRDYKAMKHVPEILIAPWQCTRRLSQNRFKAPYDVENYKLDTMCKKFGLEGQLDIHGAKDDAIKGGYLFLELNKC